MQIPMLLRYIEHRSNFIYRAFYNKIKISVRNYINRITALFKNIQFFPYSGKMNFAVGISIAKAKENTLIILPHQPNLLACGISALLAFKGRKSAEPGLLEDIGKNVLYITDNASIPESKMLQNNFPGGDERLEHLFGQCRKLRQGNHFAELFFDSSKRESLFSLKGLLEQVIKDQEYHYKSNLTALAPAAMEIITRRLEILRDIVWCIKKEILENIEAIKRLSPNLKNSGLEHTENKNGLCIFKRINAVINSIDRLEVRGRDSAGISVMFTLTQSEFENFKNALIKAGLSENLRRRTNHIVLTNNSLTIHESLSETGEHLVSLAFVYKCAAEIGSLGDNMAFIRTQIRNDLILQLLCQFKSEANSIIAHTRWASVGDINTANCHPQDNTPLDASISKTGIIHVCLNGDIDNFRDLKIEYEANYDKIHPEINTDTKLIPLQIEHYLKQGNTLEEAFRLALNDFEGSHAISMHSDLAPGKLFLAQKGSGQTIFVGLAHDHYMAASEIYGIVEETRDYIKLNGEDKGQIVILDRNSNGGGLSGIQSYYYDGTHILLEEQNIRTSHITSGDIDRQHFPHYFLKEISESPDSVERTIENKFVEDSETHLISTHLDNSIIPESLLNEFRQKKIKKIYFIGQGTAGIAAQGCAEILNEYLGDTGIYIRAMKASELSGFCLIEGKGSAEPMSDTLVVAISQSGTTTDTNKTVDMAKACGARTLAIVNRRDSDLSFKTDGILYTSSGRDIEMSVASTKAFYSQITAGGILGIHLAGITESLSKDLITEEIKEILTLPDKMRMILAMKDKIKASASRLAVSKSYWATVGSGANKTASDEIRIKLSELCYKTISSDFIEDKKHIDLSSEPLIIICAAGTRKNVLSDIIKDTAIFKAHKATPVVITTIDENRFDHDAADVFKIPSTKEYFAPILNTLVGHLWGYYAALAINEGSEFMYKAKLEIQELLDEYMTLGHDAYEVLLEKKFREAIAELNIRFSRKLHQGGFPSALGLDSAANITLLLKYLSGRIPVSDFEMDFGVKGTPANMLNSFFTHINNAINIMARPVDAIKHQAKTVTVGTSRISEEFEGIIFDELNNYHIQLPQITNKNVPVIKNLQEVISGVNGGLLYRISGLNLLGEVSEDTRIKIIRRTGVVENECFNMEEESSLTGTKNIIVREGNVYIGKSKKDKRNILIIPVISANPVAPNVIEYLLALNISFKPSKEVSLLKKIKALGGKYNRLKDWILERGNFQWDDRYLTLVEVDTLFGETAEKVVEIIVSQIEKTPLS